MALSSTLIIDWAAVLVKARDLANSEENLSKRVAMVLASGTGANQADLLFDDTRVVATTATDSINLISGLTNGVGDAVVFAKLKGLLVVASATNVNNVNVQRPSTTGVPIFLAASDGMAVRPGGYLAWASPDATGVAVTTLANVLEFVNSGGGTSVSYDLVLIGTTV